MVKIRLRRCGRIHYPFYRVVVSDSKLTPTARVLETVGHYNPNTDPSEIDLNQDRIKSWLDQGAQMSPQVRNLWNKTRTG